MSWSVWIFVAVGVIAVFVFWDLIFCGGKRCKELIDRMGPRNSDGSE